MDKLTLQIIVISILTLLSFVYCGIAHAKLRAGGKRTMKYFWHMKFPMIVIFAPCLEELIFRLPLILLFNDFSPMAWIALGVSSIIFGLAHKNQEKTNSLLDVVDAQHKSDTIRIYSKIGPIPQLILGTLLAFLSIRYQSLALCVGVHMIWNLIACIAVYLSLLSPHDQESNPSPSNETQTTPP